MKSQPIIYVLVITYNRLSFLKQCLDSIKKQTYPVKKIIVVDNCSTDGTRDYLKKLYQKDKVFQIIFNKDNLGMANAINLALMTIQVEDWDYLWITDDDNIADKDCLKNLLISNSDTIVSPVLLEEKTKKPVFPLIDSKTGKIYYELENIKNHKITYSTPFNFTLIPRKEIEYINEDYFIRGEERDFITKKILSGAQIEMITSAYASCLTKRKLKKFKFLGLTINREMIDSKKNYYTVRNTFFLIKKYRKHILISAKKNYIINFYPYYKYNLIFFMLFYFFYLIFLFLFIYRKDFFENMKYTLLAYYHFLVGKKGRID